LPSDPDLIPSFLKHVWAFDQLNLTKEAKNRTAFYQQNVQRAQLRNEYSNLQDFLVSLNLECAISEMTADQIARVSELTLRTNQFNTNTVRRSVQEVQNFCAQPGQECFVLKARDRFGDYGLVGVAFTKQSSSALVVDSLLLSCRALGRGIEHQILAHLGNVAAERALKDVHIPFVRTAKNQPALDFLAAVSPKDSDLGDNDCMFHIPATIAATVSYVPDQARPRSNGTSNQSNLVSGNRTGSKLMMRIATELCDVAQIDAAITRRRKPELKRRDFIPPRTPFEEALGNIWKELLRIDQVGIHDDFLALGGNSLLGTVLISRIGGIFGIELPLHRILEQPTIAELAALIEQQLIDELEPETLAATIEELDGFSNDKVSALIADAASGLKLMVEGNCKASEREQG
jgi:hypothetical protein